MVTIETQNIKTIIRKSLTLRILQKAEDFIHIIKTFIVNIIWEILKPHLL